MNRSLLIAQITVYAAVIVVGLLDLLVWRP